MSDPTINQPDLRPIREGHLNVPLRSRIQPFKGVEEWSDIVIEATVEIAETALLLCDVWDGHWCRGAEERLEAMIPTMNAVAHAMRELGVQIVHAPSDTMVFYTDTPQRERMQAAPHEEPPTPIVVAEPPLPVDSSDHGCDTEQTEPSHCWSRQHSGIDVREVDGVSDDGQEVYNLFRQLGIHTMFIMGVHTNMCVLNRSFSIRQMTSWGVRVVLVRDLTDAMYNPAMPPHVTHGEGTRLVIEHIEKYLCPTVLSADLLAQPV